MERERISIERLRQTAEDQGVEPDDEALKAAQAAIERLLPGLAELEQRMPEAGSP